MKASSNALSEPIFSSDAGLQQTPLQQSPVSQLTFPTSPGIHTLNSPSSCAPQGKTASSKKGQPAHPLSPFKLGFPLSRIPNSTPEPASPAPHYLTPLSISPPHNRGHSSESYRARSHLHSINGIYRNSGRQSLLKDRSTDCQLPQHLTSALRSMEEQIEHLTSLVETVVERQDQEK